MSGKHPKCSPVFVKSFLTGYGNGVAEFRAPCGCHHWGTGKFEYCATHAAAPDLFALAERLYRLNRDAGEIGAGMLASLVDDARAALKLAEAE